VVVLASLFLPFFLFIILCQKKLAIAIFLSLYRTDTICILGDGLKGLLLRWQKSSFSFRIWIFLS
jgi:hypothetical protein